MRPLYIFLLFGLILSILFSSGQIENPDTHLRLTQARSMIQESTFGIPSDVGEDMHGNIAINKSGQRYMVYNPGQTVFFIPIYYFARLFCSEEVSCYYLATFNVSFINFFIHSICAFYLFKIALLIGVAKQRAYLLSAFFGLTSYSFVFAQSTYEHHFEMLFILMSAFYALKSNTKNGGAMSGVMLSLGLFFRTSTILAAPAILLMQKGNKARLQTMLGLSVGVGVLLFYNYYRFGDPLESGYSLAWTLAHGEKFNFWAMSRLPSAIFGFLLSPGKGLLFFSPTILIAMLGVRSFWVKKRRMAYSILLITLTYLGFFSLNFAWHGSVWSYGPRYILPVVPFLYLPIIYVKPRKWFIPTLIIAFILQVLLISVNYKRDVLEEYVAHNGLSDLKYIYTLKKEPHIVQAKQFAIILPKQFSNLNNYQPNSPWKKEVRTGSNIKVVNSSIEKNSINFWWIRIFHWKVSAWSRIFSVIILIAGSIGFFILIRYVKRKII